MQSISRISFKPLSTPSRAIEEDVTPSDDWGTSREVWQQGSTSPALPDVNIDWLFTFKKSQEVTDVLNHLPQSYHPAKSIRTTYQHITLIEALIYQLLLTEDISLREGIATWKIEKTPQMRQPLLIQVTLRYNTSRTINWTISYDPAQLKCAISQYNQQIGEIRYIHRAKRLEEITGHIKHKKIILDPVWQTKAEDGIKEEHITIGAQRFTLIYNGLNRYACYYNTKGKRDEIKIQTSPNQRVKSTWLIQKTTQIKNWQLTATLIFSSHILIPITGQIKITDKSYVN